MTGRKSRQRGLLLNPFRFGAGGGGGPTDPNFANVGLLLHMDGADASTTFTDSSASAKTGTALGNAQIDTAVSKFGGASGLFDGTGDAVSFADSADWNFGSGNFTIELFARPSALGVNQYLVSQIGPFTNSLLGFAIAINDTNKIVGFIGDGTSSLKGFVAGTTSISTGSFRHIAYVRNGDVFTIWLDGNSEGSTTSAFTQFNSSSPLHIGRAGDSPNESFYSGWIDEVRITKGVARYTAAFTPPTAAFPNS